MSILFVARHYTGSTGCNCLPQCTGNVIGLDANVGSRSPIMLRSQHVRVATTRGRGSEAQTGSSSFSARFNVRLRRLLYIQPGCRSLLRHHTLCLLLCVLAAHQGGPRHEGSPRPRLIRLLRHHTTVSPLTVIIRLTQKQHSGKGRMHRQTGATIVYSHIGRLSGASKSVMSQSS
jgi:hypothetical protein